MSDRKALKDLWHPRLMGAKLRLEAAQLELDEVLRDTPIANISGPDWHYAYRQAVKGERLALQEYARVQRIYENLTVHDIIPDEDVLGKEAASGK
jgi:hypothetical protein